MKKEEIIGILIIIAVIAIVIVVYTSVSGTKTEASISQESIPASSLPVLTKDTMPVYLQNQDFVQELPDDAVLSLKLYNFNTGERVWEESYAINRGVFEQEAAQSPDIEIILHSKYVPELANFCATIQKAEANNDVEFLLKMDSASFAWKYRGMMKYKDCFGF